MGTLDGPGVRYVLFLQGCPIRCCYCHNPETWPLSGGSLEDSAEIAEKMLRYRSYFGAEGGVTLSGGEPLLQGEFCCDLMDRLAAEGIGTALDTSGMVQDDWAMRALEKCALILLDIKMTNEADYEKYTRGSLQKALDFLDAAERLGKPAWLRQVILPGINDTEESILKLRRIAREHRNVQRVELLPLRKLCLEKYESLGIPFPLKDSPTPTLAQMKTLQALVDSESED